MSLTADFVYDNIMYDLLVDGKVSYHGNVEYVSGHFTDGEVCELRVSSNQPESLKSFMEEYRAAKVNEPGLSMDKFIKRKTI